MVNIIKRSSIVNYDIRVVLSLSNFPVTTMLILSFTMVERLQD